MDLYAQDTIYFRTRELKPAKVEEVGPTLTKYKNNKIPDGPVYIIKTADLDSIKYKNGTTDRFNKSSAEMSQVGFTTDNRIKLIGKRYISQGRKIKHKEMLNVMETFGKQKDNKELLHLIDKHGRYCSLESVFLKSVIVSGSICVGVSAFVFVLSLNPDSPPQQPLFLQSLSLFTFPVGFGIATLLNGHSKKEKFMNVLILYNSLN